MKVRELIEQLSRCGWDSEARIDSRKDVAPSEICNFKASKRIKSISSYMHKGKPVVTLNIRGI